ncbi:hypothetical protein JCM10213_007336 [Rhodosporidiobolus nylandii]
METLSATLAYGWQHPFLLAGLVLLAVPPSLVLYLAYLSFVRPRRSSLRDVPGPPPDSFWSGNLARIFAEEPGASHIEWSRKYPGGAVKYSGFAGDQRLLLTDPTALNYVLLSNAYSFPKPDEVRGDLAMILGKGILFAEGDDHRRQRRIMQPSFSAAHLRELVPLFFEQAHKLSDIWKDHLKKDYVEDAAWKDADAVAAYKATRKSGEMVIDVLRWFNRVTLDIIGLAGFGYYFGALDQEENPLAKAFGTMFSAKIASRRPTVKTIMTARAVGMVIRALPVLKIADWLPYGRVKRVREGFRILQEESEKIIVSKQNAVEKDGLDSIRGSKDLIALLLKSIQNDGKASMTNTELRGQLTTFLLAGHETTSTALTWTLYALSRMPEKQERLRQEVRAARAKAAMEGRAELESHELDALEYLDAREILRLEAPVTATVRHAAHDDHIPLSSPIPSAVDPSRTISSITVEEGQTIFIPILAVNRNKEIFGEDADEFRPERWIEGEGEKKTNVGAWSNILTFLAGPRSCIGFKFALLELKALLSVVIDDFEFSLRNEDLKIERRSQIVTRPLIVGEETLGTRMPLRVRLARREE